MNLSLAPRPRRAFTLIELLTVIAIIGILAAILIPVTGRVREAGRRAKCMSNVRQITISLINGANQNRGQAFPTNVGGNWAWDVAHSVAKDLVSNAGREVFYCPSSNMLELNPLENMWRFGGSLDSFAVTTYVLLIDGTKQVNDIYKNDKIRSEYPVPRNAPTSYVPASRRALVVDAIISDSASTSSFSNVGGGLPVNMSNHMAGAAPMGAHTGFVDGHVTWRTFKLATLADTSGFSMKSDGSSPKFWF